MLGEPSETKTPRCKLNGCGESERNGLHGERLPFLDARRAVGTAVESMVQARPEAENAVLGVQKARTAHFSRGVVW
jgi:hypothetical protein